MNRTISIVSTGPGHMGLLTQRAIDVIKNAKEVFATGKVAGTLPAIRNDWRIMPYSSMAEIAIESKADDIALLISGDAGFFDIVETLKSQLSQYADIICYAGISSVQYLCAKTGKTYQDMHCMEYGSENLLAAVSFHKKTAVLLDGENIPDLICRELCSAGLSKLKVTVGSKLASGRERIVTDEAFVLREYEFLTPAVVIIENPMAAEHMLSDDIIIKDDNFLKRIYRNIAVNLLSVKPEENIAVIGAGSGEMALEMANLCKKGSVIATETDEKSFDMLEKNKKIAGYYHLKTINSEIYDDETEFSQHVAVIGANVRDITKTLAYLKSKTKHMRVIIIADDIVRLTEANRALPTLLFDKTEIYQFGVSKGKNAGGHTMMLADKCIYFIYAEYQDAVKLGKKDDKLENMSIIE